MIFSGLKGTRTEVVGAMRNCTVDVVAEFGMSWSSGLQGIVVVVFLEVTVSVN